MQTVLPAGKMWSLSEFFIKPLYKIQNSSIFASELQMIVPTSWQLSPWKSMSRTSKSPRRATPSASDENTPAKTVEVGWENVVQRHIKGVYLTLCSWRVESSKFSNQSLEHSNGRCPRVWFLSPLPAQAKPVESCCHSFNQRRTTFSFHIHAAQGGWCFISAWALTLSVQLWRQC